MNLSRAWPVLLAAMLSGLAVWEVLARVEREQAAVPVPLLLALAAKPRSSGSSRKDCPIWR